MNVGPKQQENHKMISYIYIYIDWAYISINRPAGSNTHLQLTQWSFSVKVVRWLVESKGPLYQMQLCGALNMVLNVT